MNEFKPFEGKNAGRELMSLGATFSKVKNWGVHTIADGQLITGQNPASSGPTARVLLETLNKKTK